MSAICVQRFLRGRGLSWVGGFVFSSVGRRSSYLLLGVITCAEVDNICENSLKTTKPCKLVERGYC